MKRWQWSSGLNYRSLLESRFAIDKNLNQTTTKDAPAHPQNLKALPPKP